MESNTSKEVTIYNEIDPLHAQMIDYYITNKCTKIEAYRSIHPNASYQVANNQFRAIAERPEVKEYYQTLSNEIKEQANITAVEIANELRNQVYADRSVFAGITPEEISNLPLNQKRLIQDVRTKIRKYKVGKEIVTETTVDVKLVNKLESEKELNKMLGNYGEHNKQKRNNVNILVQNFLDKASPALLNEFLMLTKEDNNTIDIGPE